MRRDPQAIEVDGIFFTLQDPAGIKIKMYWALPEVKNEYGRRYRIKIILCAAALFLSKSLSAHGLFSNINSSYCNALPCTRRFGTPRRCWMSRTLSEHNFPRRNPSWRNRQIA
ncbi:MAG: hypothetical protein M3436_03800 [Pseudomonadota bacterium]|nr:hypothetical protein [Pseudomonadota bacterium]